MLESLKRRGFMLVLSSPSGAGKTAIAHRILETEDNMSLSVSVTTRNPRPGEVNGKDYFFVDMPAFQGMVLRTRPVLQQLLRYAPRTRQKGSGRGERHSVRY